MTLLKIKVKPNSREQKIQLEEDGSWTISLKSPPVDGKANTELIQLLAKKYKISKSEVKIKLGLSSRHKLVEIPIDNPESFLM